MGGKICKMEIFCKQHFIELINIFDYKHIYLLKYIKSVLFTILFVFSLTILIVFQVIYIT